MNTKHTPTPWYVELDPETDKPRQVDGLYAIQHDSEEVMQSRSLADLEYAVEAVNAYDTLRAQVERLRGAVGDLCNSLQSFQPLSREGYWTEFDEDVLNAGRTAFAETGRGK